MSYFYYFVVLLYREEIVMEEETINTKSKRKILPIILKIIVLVLFISSIIIAIIFGLKYKEEKQKSEDILELTSYYYYASETTSYLKDTAEITNKIMEDYFINNKYSSNAEMNKDLKEKIASKGELAVMYKEYEFGAYNRIKLDNYYYLSNSDVKKQVDDVNKELGEYYNFLFDNNKLNYITLATQKDVTYDLNITKLKSLLLEIVGLKHK